MKFCSECGSAEIQRRAEGRGTPLLQCARCGAQHRPNPRLVAACLAECNGQVLLRREAREPGPGLWALPGGDVAASEPIQAAAARLAREQAQAVVDDLCLFRVYNLPKFNEVVAVFRGTLRDARCAGAAAGHDVALFPKRDLPWEQLASESTRVALQAYATLRWQPTYASPVEDLVWLQPPKAVVPALRSAR
jgi:ADP-ribose pyrophosphatase YjhB (NUDIX family)